MKALIRVGFLEEEKKEEPRAKDLVIYISFHETCSPHKQTHTDMKNNVVGTIVQENIYLSAPWHPCFSCYLKSI